MKTYCETFNHWLHHPVDTSIVCEKRTRRLTECRRCKGKEAPKATVISKKEAVPKMIALDVDKNKWIEAVKRLQEDYEIQHGTRQDETSARRVAILVGELYLTRFREFRKQESMPLNDPLLNVTIIEKDIYDMALEYRLRCDPLEREYRVKKPNLKKLVLHVWGVDKVSGMEGFTTLLKDWTARALLEIPKAESKEKEGEYGTIDREESGPSHLGSGPFEVPGTEEIGLG